MKTWKHGIFGILAIIALTFVFIACGGDKDEHTHEWEWVVTTPATTEADGLETETCKTCGAESGETRPIAMLPKDQIDTLTNLFGEGYTATVTGYFSNTEWNGVPTKIENALNGAFTGGNGPTKSTFVFVFINNDVNIIVEKTSEYGKYKVVDGAFRTLYLNVDALDNDLQSTITAAVTAMREETPGLL